MLNMENETKQKKKIFSRYEVFVIAVLAFLQFTIILDFMVLSPLGAQLMLELKITTSQFGWVVSGVCIQRRDRRLAHSRFCRQI